MSRSAQRVVGRYALHREIAAGGMASVHLARLLGPVGFSRTVAVKRLHTHLARDPEFVGMFLDEARVAARIRHPNVVGIIDVVSADDELFLVMEYVHGAPLSALVRASRARGAFVPPPIASAIVAGALHGLHAAHEATSEAGEPLHIVHRDVSPQNILVGTDGLARVVDFGVAKASGRVQTTRDGQVKGKFAYMAPEHIRGEASRQSDVFGAAVVLWEVLTCTRLFHGAHEAEVVWKVMNTPIEPPSAKAPAISPELDEVVLRGLERDPATRFPTALAMAIALERACPPAARHEVAAWVVALEGAAIEERARALAEVEQGDESGAASHPRLVSSPSLFSDASASARSPTMAPVSPEGTRAGGRARGGGVARIAVIAAVCSALTGGVVWWSQSARAVDAPKPSASAPSVNTVSPSPSPSLTPTPSPSPSPSESPSPSPSESPSASASASASAHRPAARRAGPRPSESVDRSKYYGRD